MHNLVNYMKLADLKALMATFVYWSGFNLHGVMAQIKTETGFLNLIIGPLGALVLSVLALYIIWKYMRRKDQEITNIREAQLADKDKQIEELKEQVQTLREIKEYLEIK